MSRRFNTTGVCIPRKHYMVDISKKIDAIEKLVDQEFYFVINRPRQFGKATTFKSVILAGVYDVKINRNENPLVCPLYQGFTIRKT